jgi:hypothetical protein
LANSSCNQRNVVAKDDPLAFLGERTYVVIFLPNQVAIVKRLLQEVRAHKDNFMPTMAMLAKKTTTWQEKVKKLAHNHFDRIVFVQEEEEKFIPLQQKFFTLKKVVDNKESEMYVIIDLSMCQSIIDEIKLFLFKLLVELKVFEKQLEWQGFLWKR